MNKPFIDDFCHRVITIYKDYAPSFVAPTDIEIDYDEQWIYFRFYIIHPRLEDHILVRSQDGKINCNLCLGASTISIVTGEIDSYGTRWIVPPGASLSDHTKSRAEPTLSKIYRLTQEYKPQLLFVLGSKNFLSNVKEKASG